MRKWLFLIGFLIVLLPAFSWGFYGHRMINYQAVFLLPPAMLRFYKPHIDYLREHAADPDKRRYAVAAEGPRHYLDVDHYGEHPFDSMPARWTDAVKKFGEDSLNAHGIVPWWIGVMYQRLVAAFRVRDFVRILKYSAELGHYVADAHVPLHTSSNHNGQLTNQRGIHGFWESRIPELLAEKEWNLFTGRATYISDPAAFAWQIVRESAAAADSVLTIERLLSAAFPPDKKYAFEERNGVLVKQYAEAYTRKYNDLLNGMVERRMRQAIIAVASYWYSAWADAGQPSLPRESRIEEDSLEIDILNRSWTQGNILGREE